MIEKKKKEEDRVYSISRGEMKEMDGIGRLGGNLVFTSEEE